MREKNFDVGDCLFVQNYHQGDKWLPGIIQKKTEPVSFSVKLADGRYHRCHQDQVHKLLMEVSQDSVAEPEVSVSPTVVSIPPVISEETTVPNLMKSACSY